MGRAVARPGVVPPDAALSVDLSGPLFHYFLGIETYDEVLDARVTFPENLAGVRPLKHRLAGHWRPAEHETYLAFEAKRSR